MYYIYTVGSYHTAYKYNNKTYSCTERDLLEVEQPSGF